MEGPPKTRQMRSGGTSSPSSLARVTRMSPPRRHEGSAGRACSHRIGIGGADKGDGMARSNARRRGLLPLAVTAVAAVACAAPPAAPPLQHPAARRAASRMSLSRKGTVARHFRRNPCTQPYCGPTTPTSNTRPVPVRAVHRFNDRTEPGRGPPELLLGIRDPVHHGNARSQRRVPVRRLRRTGEPARALSYVAKVSRAPSTKSGELHYPTRPRTTRSTSAARWTRSPTAA